MEALVADTEDAFWDFVLAQQELTLTQDSRALAETELANARERVKVGRQAEIDTVALEAEVALRTQAEVQSQSQLEQARLKLLHYLNPGPDWAHYQLELASPLGIPELHLDRIEQHIQVAWKECPEILETELKIKQGKLEVLRTRDGLLPRLDLFLALGKTGYATSVPESVLNLGGNGFDYNGGLNLSYPLGVHAADAAWKKAVLTHEQQAAALENLKQSIELELRQAYQALRFQREEIRAAKASRHLQAAKLKAEEERDAVGRSTPFQLAQSQRDLLASQLDEVRSLLNYMKGLTQFYRLEGTLLARRGIAVDPPATAAPKKTP